jgi:hypothetical protein
MSSFDPAKLARLQAQAGSLRTGKLRAFFSSFVLLSLPSLALIGTHIHHLLNRDRFKRNSSTKGGAQSGRRRRRPKIDFCS